ncbi:MAG TPA: glycosyltransferase, partial [Actinomycetota bacterium]|nr:glycosyltransferase [Actinomycetota bacterium]
MPTRSDLAVVIVNYNAGAYLSRCVTSVVANAGGLELDVLVIDNASHDGSAQVAKSAQPDIRVTMNPTNRGLSAAWNQGAADTDSPWILFLNPDAEIWAGT